MLLYKYILIIYKKAGENMEIAITIIIVLAAVFLGIFLTYPIIKSTMKMHNARQGERTKFEIDTTDKGYNYYKNKVDTWLNDVGFSKYKSKKEARYLKYHKNTNVFTFGFNYYQQENKLIIETWLDILGKESPLTAISYREKNIISAISSIKDDMPKDIPLLLDQQGKDEYIDFLGTLIDMPEKINEKNEVMLLKNINVSDIKSNQKVQKSTTTKLILGIIIFSLILSVIINCFDNLNKPKASKEEQNEALEIIQNSHSSFKLTDSSSYVVDGTNYKVDSYIVYTYYGTMNTPEKENDKVVIFMRKNNACEWSGTIYQNKADGKKWNFNLED